MGLFPQYSWVTFSRQSRISDGHLKSVTRVPLIRCVENVHRDTLRLKQSKTVRSGKPHSPTKRAALSRHVKTSSLYLSSRVKTSSNILSNTNIETRMFGNIVFGYCLNMRFCRSVGEDYFSLKTDTFLHRKIVVMCAYFTPLLTEFEVIFCKWSPKNHMSKKYPNAITTFPNMRVAMFVLDRNMVQDFHMAWDRGTGMLLESAVSPS